MIKWLADIIIGPTADWWSCVHICYMQSAKIIIENINIACSTIYTAHERV